MNAVSRILFVTDARSSAMLGASGVCSKVRQSFSRMGFVRPSRLSLDTRRRKAVIGGSATPSLTVMIWVSQFTAKSDVGSTSRTFKSS